MSRFYDMSIEISGNKKGRRKQIHDAVMKEWSIETFDYGEKSAFFGGQGSLSGGESEEEFAARVTRAVWQANGAYCGVSVRATYMEDLPFETHTFDRRDYARFRKAVKLKRLNIGNS